MNAAIFLSFLLLAIVSIVNATTEWWGDLRAHLNPPKAPAFYDVTYDDECPQGLKYDAIPDFVYFGTMISSMNVDDNEECVQKCLEKPRCKAANYFQSISFQEQGFCELLSETQLDNPQLMRPFIKATYYENIRCRDVDAIEIEIDQKPRARPTKEEISDIFKKISSKATEFRARFRAARK
ncbi:unnamed protein product, partial [Mesorhabditis belari]|uniref:Apple domain-containing protein n=1 Tax=Mesorhabditis belari TaxID=2138241 RepID=A0AAF3J1C1_9BILA